MAEPCGCGGASVQSQIEGPNPGAAEAQKLLRAAGYNTSVRPASELLQAVISYDSKHLSARLGAVGIPIGSPLGQSLMRLTQP